MKLRNPAVIVTGVSLPLIASAYLLSQPDSPTTPQKKTKAQTKQTAENAAPPKPAAPDAAAKSPTVASAPKPAFDVEEYTVPTGSSVYQTLRQAGLAPATTLALVRAAEPIKDLADITSKTLINIFRPKSGAEEARKVEIKLDKVKSLVFDRTGPKLWEAEMETADVATRVEKFSGTVEESLWNSASEAGMDPLIIQKMAEIFAWQIDFNRGVRTGDRWRLAVERRYVSNEPIGWGEIVSAQYDNAGRQVAAIRFENENVDRKYYQPNGESLKRMFLKSPLKFGRVTSGFDRQRYHPILKERRPHLGVDYGAPRGTPIRAVGKGAVTYAKRRGGSGKMVRIRHNSVYKTEYKHLSRFADGIYDGARVEMGDIIGYVGATGLATGPHLHYEFWKHGKVKDPLKVEVPTADPVPEKFMDSFQTAAAKAMDKLPSWESPDLTKEERLAKNLEE